MSKCVECVEVKCLGAKMKELTEPPTKNDLEDGGK